MEREIFKYQKDLEQRVKELETRRFEVEKLAAVGQLVARVAHEINNPLAGIKNSFNLVKDAINQNHPYYRYVDLIENEINRVISIVRQIYDFYKTDQDMMSEIYLGKTVAEIVKLLDSSRRNHAVIIDVDIESQTVLRIAESSLKQVLYNVILNAIEASPRDGVIRIESVSEGDVMTLSVSDQGSGVPEKVRHQIFEPFVTTKKRLDGGLGLGLSVSKEIVEGLGGSIEFESRRGRGTVFRINLPLNMETAE